MITAENRGTRMGADEKVFVEVKAQYPFELQTYADIEDALTEIAKEHCGSCTGGGTDGCTRDVWFGFKNHSSADTFISEIEGKSEEFMGSAGE